MQAEQELSQQLQNRHVRKQERRGYFLNILGKRGILWVSSEEANSMSFGFHSELASFVVYCNGNAIFFPAGSRLVRPLSGKDDTICTQ